MKMWMRGLMVVVLLAVLSGCGGGNNSETNRNSDVDGIKGWGDIPEVINPKTDQDLANIDKIDKKVIASFSAALDEQKDTEEKSLQQVIDSLKSSPDIKAVYVQKDQLILYSSLNSRIDIPLVLPKELSGSQQSRMSTRIMGEDRNHPILSKKLSTMRTLSSSATNKKILMMVPYESYFKNKGHCQMLSDFTMAGWTVDFVSDIDFCGIPKTDPMDRLDYYRNMYKYDIVYLDGHSGEDSISTNIVIKNYKDNSVYKKFRKDFGEGVHTRLSHSHIMIGLNSNFFSKLKHNFKDNSILIIDSCNAGDSKNKFAKKIIDKGIDLYIAHDNYTDIGTTYKFVSPFLAKLLQSNTSVKKAKENASTNIRVSLNGFQFLDKFKDFVLFNDTGKAHYAHPILKFSSSKNENNLVLTKTAPDNLRTIEISNASLKKVGDSTEIDLSGQTLLGSGEYEYTVKIKNISGTKLLDYILIDKNRMTNGISANVIYGANSPFDLYVKPGVASGIENSYPWYIITDNKKSWSPDETKTFKIRLKIENNVNYNSYYYTYKFGFDFGRLGIYGTKMICSKLDSIYDMNFASGNSAVITLDFHLDIDEDRMPDDWEKQYGLDPTTNDAAADKDGDGATNLAEYQAGTDPTDPESKPDTPNHPPTANAGADQQVASGATVTLDGSRSYDPDGQIVSYVWSENGSQVGTGVSVALDTVPDGVHTYTLTVMDDDNATASDSVTVRVGSTVTTHLKKTGQTKSYDENGTEVTDGSIKDDGYYQKGVTPSYTRDDAKEIVTDNITGLQWQDNNDTANITKPWLTQENYDKCTGSNDQEQDTSKCTDTSGDTATTYCANLSLGGYSDWRLPTIDELMYIADRSRSNPAIDPTFQNTRSGYYWSSTSIVGYEDGAWHVGFYGGSDNWLSKSLSYYVRCVRAGE